MNLVLIVLAVIVAIVGMIILIYNGLVMKRQRVNQAFADVDVQLKQRQNLIPNLVETVKGYAKHEQETFQQVIAARNAAQAANTAGDMARAEGVLSQALGKLFALAEAYPDLKANTNFLQLQNELSSIEDKLAAARRANHIAQITPCSGRMDSDYIGRGSDQGNRREILGNVEGQIGYERWKNSEAI